MGMSKKRKTRKDVYEDLFRLIQLQQNKYWDDQTHEQKIGTHAYLYVTFLQAAENFVRDITLGQTPTEAQFRNHLENGDIHDVEKIRTYFKQLRHDPVWFLTEWRLPIQLSIWVQVFLEQCRRLENILNAAPRNAHFNTSQNESFRFLAMPECKIVDDFFKPDDDFAFFKLIDNIQVALETPKFQLSILQHQNATYDRQVKVSKYVADCFNICPELCVIHMDLWYRPPLREGFRASYVASDESSWVSSAWRQFSREISIRGDGIIGFLGQLEKNFQGVFLIHAVFFCNHQKQLSEEEWVKFIGELWCESTPQDQGAYHNCNIEIRLRIPEAAKAAGTIRASDKSKHAALQHWGIDYFTLSPELLSIRPPKQVDGLLMGNPPQLSVIDPQVKTGNSSFFTYSGDTDLEKIWGLTVSPQHVKKVSSHHELQILYKEISQRKNYYFYDKEATHSTPDAHYFQSVNRTIWSADLLSHIEIFISLVSTCNRPAFELSSRYQRYPNLLDQANIVKLITPVGKQLNSLLTKNNLYDIEANLLPYTTYLSIPVRIFCLVLETFPQWGKPDHQANVFGLMEMFNHFVLQIRHYLNGGIELFSKPDVSKSDDVKSIQRHHTVKSLIANQQKIAHEKYSNAQEYIDQLFIKDLMLISLKLYINRGQSHIPYDVFSPLLTKFLRFGKNSRPMAWSIGYFGRWEYIAPTELCAHLIFFMDESKVLDSERSTIETVQDIGQYWQEIIEAHHQKEPMHDSKGKVIEQITGSISESPMYCSSEDFQDFYCRIELNDIAKQNSFKEQVALYLTKSDLYFQTNIMLLPRNVIKGSKPNLQTDAHITPKKKKVQVLLSSPTTTDPIVLNDSRLIADQSAIQGIVESSENNADITNPIPPKAKSEAISKMMLMLQRGEEFLKNKKNNNALRKLTVSKSLDSDSATTYSQSVEIPTNHFRKTHSRLL